LFGLISVSGIPHMFLLGRARSLLPANALGLGLGLFGVVIFLGFGIMTTFAGWMLALGAYLGLSAAGSFALVFLATAALIALTALCFPLASRRTVSA
jgi:Na+-transporting methylmalonyl-CoA/oxaloacetate decarboxylase beta subunit